MNYSYLMEPSIGGQGLFCASAAVLILGLAGGCAKGPAQAAPPQEVQVIGVEQRDVPVVDEWVGTLDGFVDAQIRAQVTGYLVKQDYKEGTAVRKGDALFEIDPRPFAAALAQAEGLLGQAQAQLGKAELDVERYTPLAQEKAISQEELDDAVQARLAAEAQVASARAGGRPGAPQPGLHPRRLPGGRDRRAHPRPDRRPGRARRPGS